MFFDSHAHLDDKRFDEDRDEVISSFDMNGIDSIINVGSDMKTSEFSLKLAEKYDIVYATAGIHPEGADNNDNDLDRLTDMLRHKKCVALGEIGLDYHYDTPSRENQRKMFEEECILAKKLDMPVIIHDRDAHEECFEMVKKHGLHGVFHCYSGSKEMAVKLVGLGFYISFTGVLTFKNARRAVEAAKEIPMNRLLIETDCPYMAPEPHRGVRNEPRFVRHVAEKLSEIKGLTLEETAKITAENTKRLFGIK